MKAETGELVWAARLWGVAEAWREAICTPIPLVYLLDYQQTVAAARTQLDEEIFAASRAEGRTMTPEQAVTSPTSDP